MARFVRTPEARKHRYPWYRRQVRESFGCRCAYCLMHEWGNGGESSYNIDHFRPKSLFPALADEYSNLYWACACNGPGFKHDKWPSDAETSSGAGFVDFCRDDVDQHYDLAPDGTLVPCSGHAVYTIRVLKLNERPDLVEARRLLRAAFGAEWHSAGTLYDLAESATSASPLDTPRSPVLD